jgi:pyruvate dehydrogenase E2 component (dihydrolipoamide acetyltransferase)
MQPTETSKPVPESDRIFASPLARKTADEMGIPLREIQGTGPRGRIIHADVEAQASMMKSKPLAAADTFADIPLSNIRKVTVDQSTLLFC